MASDNYHKSLSRQDFSNNDFCLKDVELLRTIGTGTFGRVLAIWHKRSNRYYALKILAIERVVELKQIEHVRYEKSILFQLDHPFIVKLYWTNHDPKFLYMLFEYICGGELFTYLRNMIRFSCSTAKFFAAEMISVLSFLHERSIVYRDLKPENLLLDIRGHLKVTDFGFAKVVRDRTYTMCGTPEYIAPEVIQVKGYNKAVDWWALGIFIYEMLYGSPPFYADTNEETCKKILKNELKFPDLEVDDDAKDLIKRLLVVDGCFRLGNIKGGSADVQQHPWFNGINWDDVVNEKLTPPIKPKVMSCGDTSMYDIYHEQDWRKVPVSNQISQSHFKDF